MTTATSSITGKYNVLTAINQWLVDNVPPANAADFVYSFTAQTKSAPNQPLVEVQEFTFFSPGSGAWEEQLFANGEQGGGHDRGAMNQLMLDINIRTRNVPTLNDKSKLYKLRDRLRYALVNSAKLDDSGNLLFPPIRILYQAYFENFSAYSIGTALDAIPPNYVLGVSGTGTVQSHFSQKAARLVGAAFTFPYAIYAGITAKYTDLSARCDKGSSDRSTLLARVSLSGVTKVGFYSFEYFPGTGLARISNPSSVLGSATFSVANPSDYVMRFLLDGSTLTAYLDGVQVVQVTDTLFESGMIGIETFVGPAFFTDVTLVTDTNVVARVPIEESNHILEHYYPPSSEAPDIHRYQMLVKIQWYELI